MNPLQLEQEFRQLKELLKITTVKRYKLKLILEFFSPIEKTESAFLFKSYFLEIAPYLNELFAGTNFANTNLAFFKEILKFLDAVEANLKPPDNIFSVVTLKRLIYSQQEKIIASVRSRMKHTTDYQEELESVGELFVPLLEKQITSGVGECHFSSLLPLNVEVILANKKTSDELIISRHIGDNTKAAESALTAARVVARKLAKREPNQKLIARCWLNDQNYFIGESLMAGLAAVICCRLMNILNDSYEYSFIKNIAITGGIRNDGALTNVDEDGLRIKIEACFFSSIKAIIIPQEQELLCKEYLAVLESIYPELPTLILIPIKNISDIFRDRRIVSVKKIPSLVRATKRIWKSRRLLAILIFILMAGVIAKSVYGPLDRNPVKHIYKGKYLIIQNKYGDELDAIELNAVSIKRDLDPAENMKFVDYMDIDGDGINEVFYCKRVEGTFLDEIFCKSISRNQIIWKKSLARTLVFPNNPVEEQEYMCGSIRLVTNIHTQPPFLLAIAKSPFFPSYIIKLDAKSGNELQCYVNTGGLNIMKFYDLDGDKIEEVLITGINNAFRAAIFIVFDPRYISGHSPLTDKYKLDGYGAGSEKYYILFPASPLAVALKEQHLFGDASYFDIYPELEKIRLHIGEAFSGTEKGGVYYVYLDFSMKPVSMNTSTQYDRSIEALVKQGKIGNINPDSYSHKFLDEISYWDGTKFVKTVTKNKLLDF